MSLQMIPLKGRTDFGVSGRILAPETIRPSAGAKAMVVVNASEMNTASLPLQTASHARGRRKRESAHRKLPDPATGQASSLTMFLY